MAAESPLVELRTLGCKVNRSESESLAESLAARGVRATVVAHERPDAIVVNTCTVTGEADAKARKEVRRALEATGGPVVVAGCLAAVDAPALRALGDRVIVEPDRGAVADAVVAAVGGARMQRPQRTTGRASGVRTRALVKVQDGCDNRCSYCIVPDARGLPRSEPAADVMTRVAALVRTGTAEIVLTGVNIGRYSSPDAPDLAALVERLAATGIRRIRLSSIEPPDLDGSLLGVLAASEAAAPHLHVPLQSGCDRTLAAMGRRYDTAAYAEVLASARAALPGLAVTTDVIVGFPGETDADFAESLAFIGSCGFARLHVFRYSARAGTPAAVMPVQVPDAVRADRARALRELSGRLERAHASSRSGQHAMLLIEEVSGTSCRGTTEDHLRVSGRLAGVRVGDLVPVVLRAGRDGTLRAYHGDGEAA